MCVWRKHAIQDYDVTPSFHLSSSFRSFCTSFAPPRKQRLTSDVQTNKNINEKAPPFFPFRCLSSIVFSNATMRFSLGAIQLSLLVTCNVEAFSVAPAAVKYQDIHRRTSLSYTQFSSRDTSLSFPQQCQLQQSSSLQRCSNSQLSMVLGGSGKDKNNKDKKPRGTRIISRNNAPTLSRWRMNPDGSITGRISNSSEYKNNQSVTTAPIREKDPQGDSVVTTITGSKYFLKGKTSRLYNQPKPKKKKPAFRATYSISKPWRNKQGKTNANQNPVRGTISLTSGKTVDSKSVKKDARKTSKGSFFMTEIDNPRPTVKEQNIRPKKGSIFFASEKDVPILRKWRQNADGSITGRITGSSDYRDNSLITTSKFRGRGKPNANTTIMTVGGTKYFLEGLGVVQSTNIPFKGTAVVETEDDNNNKSSVSSCTMRISKLHTLLLVNES